MTHIAVEPEHLAIVQDILANHLPPDIRVWVYGSRSGNGRRPRRGSDLDLAIDAGRKLAPHVAWDIRDALTESLLPYTVDVLDWHDVSTEFLERIRPTMVPLPLPVVSAA